MRTLRITFLVTFILFCAAFLFEFARFEYRLCQMGTPDIHMLTEPRFSIYTPYTRAHGERGGWSFNLGDPPEGTRSLVYLPAAPTATVLLAVLGYSVFATFKWRGSRVV